MNRDDFIKSPGFMFSVAMIYFNLSPLPTKATFAERCPSNRTSITLSSFGAPVSGPSRSYLTQ